MQVDDMMPAKANLTVIFIFNFSAVCMFFQHTTKINLSQLKQAEEAAKQYVGCQNPQHQKSSQCYQTVKPKILIRFRDVLYLFRKFTIEQKNHPGLVSQIQAEPCSQTLRFQSCCELVIGQRSIG